MIKLTFEGATLRDVLVRIKDVITEAGPLEPNILGVQAQGPGPVAATAATAPPVDKPVDSPVDKPVDTGAEDEKTRKRNENLAKGRATRAANKAKAVEKAAAPAAPAPAPAAKAPDKAPDPIGKEPPTPAELVAIRQKTIEDLQQGYANGFEKEVFELLSRFGNGAKSFRELPPEAFPAIREAIDLGALSS